jgi:hypothetical protein
MKITDIQMLALSFGHEIGPVDGIAGPRTLGLGKILGVNQSWSKKRQLIAIGQMLLNAEGYEAGKVDGYVGHNTSNAFSQWAYEHVTGKPEKISKKPIDFSTNLNLPTQAQVPSFYGSPGSQIKSRLQTITLPFDLRIDWNLNQRVNRVTLHEKCAPSFRSAIIDVRDHYGGVKMKALGIDRYAGGYNHRKMRGGNKWSMHAYACAVDFYAKPNGLRTKAPQALFSKPDYKDFLDIMESYGWLNGGRLWGADYMHFQQATLR